jgi:xanthine dehydrogenase YagR molybdenum-binding subunit
MTSINWPPQEKRKLIGKRIERLDGPAKSSGAAKYALDIQRPDMLYGKILGSPIAAGTLKSIDTKAAEALKGVEAVHLLKQPGATINYAGEEILALAATTEEIATEALRLVEAQYDVGTAQVIDSDPAKVEGRARTQNAGDTAKAFSEAAATVEGRYGIACITHCCLEPHGQVSEYSETGMKVWPSTQSVSGVAGQLTDASGLPASKIEVDCQYMGGGFGSKFGPGLVGSAGVSLSKKAGKPVKLLYERDLELMVAGNRPSAFADVKLACDKDGVLTAWESKVWGSGGVGNFGAPNVPYVFSLVPNRNTTSQGIKTNRGPVQAWRAPNSPQACLITMAALEDLAAKLGMDPLDFFLKNLDFVQSANLRPVYKEELELAAQLFDYRSKAHPRGDKTPGPIKRGIGISLHTWGGQGHRSQCDVTINPDGSVATNIGTQDLGVGTRTCIGIVVAESLGLPLEAVQVNIGRNAYPHDDASGGSTTIGGVSSSSRRAAIAALNELLKKVADQLQIDADKLEAAEGRIREIDNPQKGVSWKEACKLLGQTSITKQGAHTPGARTELTGSGVGGVQMADVSVDIETGLVTINEMLAVQDCGLIVDLKTAESQVYGALIMGVTYALFEEAIYDPTTGRMLNPDMEFYRLAGLSDVGKLQVHMMTGEKYDAQGVIGLGEPPVISPGAAISNAVANAIGVRVPSLPLTADRVLAALEKQKVEA